MPTLWSALAPGELAGVYAWPKTRSFRLNLIVNSGGEVTGTDGTSQSLTNLHDREILRLIRADADVVIVGAASVRAEGWFLPPHGEIAIVSRSAELPAGCPDPGRVRQISFNDLKSIAAAHQHTLCEGGQRVATEALKQGLVTELCVTFAGGESAPPALPEWIAVWGDWDLATDIVDATHRFTIWRRGA